MAGTKGATRWPYCGHALHADCGTRLLTGDGNPRCPHCRVDQQGCLSPALCRHGAQPGQRCPD
eukprot:11166898-Lingulodinium_polyedra.AAC.1